MHSEMSSVEAFLMRRPELLRIMPDVVRVVRECLPDSDITVRLYTDPEIDDQYLVLWVHRWDIDGVRCAMDRILYMLPDGEWIQVMPTCNPALQDDIDFLNRLIESRV